MPLKIWMYAFLFTAGLILLLVNVAPAMAAARPVLSGVIAVSVLTPPLVGLWWRRRQAKRFEAFGEDEEPR